MEEEQLTKRERRALAKEEKRKLQEKAERAGEFKKLVMGLFLVAVAYGGYRFVSRTNTSVPDTQEVVEVSDSEWIKGDRQAQVTLIEYSDFQCPACKSYYPMVDRLSSEVSEGLRIVYRHFPLLSIHPNAEGAARASEAAGRQGKFWEMHDKLFENQERWSSDGTPEDKFEGFAEEIGLDAERYRVDYESDEVKEAVDSDLASGNRIGLNSTPSFLLNGRKIQNPQSYEVFKELIEDEVRGYAVE